MSDLVKLFFLCNQGLNTLLLVPHKAMLGIMATGCIFAKSEKGRGRKIIFPHRVGSVTFFGETRDAILSTGEEIRSPHRVLGRGKNALYYEGSNTK